jgi:hypothetical protein
MRASGPGRDHLVFGSILRSSAAERPGRSFSSGISAGMGWNCDMLIEHLGAIASTAGTPVWLSPEAS